MKMLFSLLFPAQFSTFRASWKEAWSTKTFRSQAILTIITVTIIIAYISQFFNYIQSKPGYRINDLILNGLQPRNMSLYIFLLIYSVIFLSVINLSCKPILLLKCIQAFCVLVVIRFFCMYLVPLEPEQSIIPLVDPLVGRLFYQGAVITKDLFFSGHVSTLTLLSLAIPFRPLKYFFILATILVAIFILLQHVHYTIDVVAAPFFSWICYTLVQKYGLK